MAALTHDFGELVINDIPRPWKEKLAPGIKEFEDQLLELFAQHFNIPFGDYAKVASYDHAICDHELYALGLTQKKPKSSTWRDIVEMTPREAERFWVAEFAKELGQ